MLEALCRSSGTTLDSVHAEDWQPISADIGSRQSQQPSERGVSPASQLGQLFAFDLRKRFTNARLIASRVTRFVACVGFEPKDKHSRFHQFDYVSALSGTG